ncbi:uncharacterized protein BXZ73DRAFT_90568 [Epithele typhae]|uniref:uncharacterized protein n=1 Tax=Epithele typhae TaxID=378194 RepID=UPI002007C8A6|nr:uncharacterized protein BXZ73DRAFT_90568 [Epithele typhae]KAH9928497.1 hypothetical protein BXZ73DRAFT_90568 [Epithele typhae]
MSPILPQELIDVAINHLWNDIRALAACALTCHACLHSARTHLFRDQRLTGSKDYERFASLLERFPEVTRYVHKLSVTEPTSNSYAQPWVNHISGLIVQLTRLASLELIGLRYVSLAHCAPETLAAFGQLSELVFADVHFDHFADVHKLLAAARNVDSLCFYRVGWAHATGTPPFEEAPAPPPTPLRLRRLVIDSWAASLMLREWVLPCAEQGDFAIKSLMVRWRERDAMDVLDSLLRVCGSALEHLYLELPSMTEEFSNVPTLGLNTGLRTLEIDGLVLPGWAGWASSLLAGLRTVQLEKLVVSMLVLRNDVLPSFEWGQLDDVLALPQFATVALAVTVNRALHPNNDPAAMRDAVMAHLPRVHHRGRLSISCS